LLAQSVSQGTTQQLKTRKHPLKSWSLKNTAQDAGNILSTERLSENL
jgi:hypothetical protein